MHEVQQSLGVGSGVSHANPVDVKWQETLDKAAAGVVSVKFCHTRSFDGEKAVSSEATGFVVDAERGYVLRTSMIHLKLISVVAGISSRTDMFQAQIPSGADASSKTMKRSMLMSFTTTPSMILGFSASIQKPSNSCPCQPSLCDPTSPKSLKP